MWCSIPFLSSVSHSITACFRLQLFTPKLYLPFLSGVILPQTALKLSIFYSAGVIFSSASLFIISISDYFFFSQLYRSVSLSCGVLLFFVSVLQFLYSLSSHGQDVVLDKLLNAIGIGSRKQSSPTNLEAAELHTVL